MKKRLLVLFFALSVSQVQAQLATPVKRPNVLLIVADDMNWDTPGCFGGAAPGITPNIDKLASEGMRFWHAYVNVSNNAGIAHIGTAETTSEEDFDRILKINAKGVYNCLHHVLPGMVEAKSGVVLNLASIASRLGISERFAYSASKGAGLAMTLSVAKDYVDKGIRCNCLCPGRVQTPFVDGYLKEYYPDEEKRAEMFRKLSEYQPMGRMGQPEEIAALATFLCSDEAAFITGSAYDVDGGTMLLR